MDNPKLWLMIWSTLYIPSHPVTSKASACVCKLNQGQHPPNPMYSLLVASIIKLQFLRQSSVISAHAELVLSIAFGRGDPPIVFYNYCISSACIDKKQQKTLRQPPEARIFVRLTWSNYSNKQVQVISPRDYVHGILPPKIARFFLEVCEL